MQMSFIGESEQIKIARNSRFHKKVSKIFGRKIRFIPSEAADLFMSLDFTFRHFTEMVMIGKRSGPQNRIRLAINFKAPDIRCISRIVGQFLIKNTYILKYNFLMLICFFKLLEF